MPEQETSISELVGRAWDDTRRRVPDLTVFTDAQDLVVGFATPGYPCDDVRCAQPRITSNYTGRERFARDDTIDTLRAYGIFFWVPIGPANLPKTLSGSNSPCAIQAALLVPPRRFPPPWSVEEAEACFIVKTDSAGHRHCLQQLQSPRNRYALRKLQKAPHCRVQAAGTEAVSRVDPHHPIGRLKRMTLGKFFVAGLVALFGGTIKPAHAQFPYPIPPPPPPIFNPSTPNTMPP